MILFKYFLNPLKRISGVLKLRRQNADTTLARFNVSMKYHIFRSILYSLKASKIYFMPCELILLLLELIITSFFKCYNKIYAF